MNVEKGHKKYSDFYKTEFGEKVLNAEMEYIMMKLGECKDILSIGCGPAVIETKLAQLNPQLNIVGLDISEKMLVQVPHPIKIILGTAESLPLKTESFDGVLNITSLEFIDDFEKAIIEANRVMKPKGRLLILMLNPKSNYFHQECCDTSSYIHKNIRHENVKEIHDSASRYFFIETEYFLGINGNRIFDTNNPKWASLYVIKCIKKEAID